MKKAVIRIGALAAIFLCGSLVVHFVIGKLVRLPEIPQPKFGHAGQWRRLHPFGWKEAYLPPASEVWKHHDEWKSLTNNLSGRFYIARLGHAERQLNFRSSTNMTSGMPLGDYHYTLVEFDYCDPTNGVYHLTWQLRGKHDPSFLKFDNTERIYQLNLRNAGNKLPPQFSIEAIEGIKPWDN